MSGDNLKKEAKTSDVTASESIVVRHAGAIMTGTAAAAAGVLNPYLGIAAAALSPFLASSIDLLVAKRAQRFQEELQRQGASTVDLSEERLSGSEEKVDLARKIVATAIETASEGKRRMLAHILLQGLRADAESNLLMAHRIARTIARTDDLEIIVLGALSKVHMESEGVTVAKLKEITNIADANLLRSGLSVLEAEGLVHFQSESQDTFRVSDYGECVIIEMRRAFGQTER